LGHRNVIAATIRKLRRSSLSDISSFKQFSAQSLNVSREVRFILPRSEVFPLTGFPFTIGLPPIGKPVTSCTICGQMGILIPFNKILDVLTWT
jgi:hypothetical protein